MSILYVITILAIYTILMLLHKTEKKQNLIMWLTITTILVLCYNTLICTIFSFINVLCTLLNLSICNIIVTAILLMFMLKTKKIQKYYVKIPDIIFSVLIFIIVILIAYEQYGFPFNIKYKTTDGSSHYFFAEQFYKNEQLLNKGKNEDVYDMYEPEYRLPGAYVNEGILFKIFDGLILKIDLFIIFDLLVLYMSGILFYYLLQRYVNGNKKLYIIAITISILYMLGYQLNSMLEGFVYLSLALDVVLALILLISSYENEAISNKIGLPILTLLTFGVFFSYGYFVPIVYISIIMHVVIKSIKNKEEVTSLENIIKLIIVIVIPLIIGMVYFLVLPVANGTRSEVSTIGRDGGIYKNYITNLLIFIPILITGIVLKIRNKNKELEYGTNLFLISLVFLILLLIGRTFRIVSNYYYFKAYYIIWPLILYNTFIALSNILNEKNKILKLSTYSYISIYTIALVIALVFNKNIAINHVFAQNTDIIKNSPYVIEREEMKFLEKVSSSVKKEDLYVLTAKKDITRRWLYSLSKNRKIFRDYLFRTDANIEVWLKDGKKYYLALNRNYNQLPNKEELEENSDKYKIIYKDEYGFILERK